MNEDTFSTVVVCETPAIAGIVTRALLVLARDIRVVDACSQSSALSSAETIANLRGGRVILVLEARTVFPDALALLPGQLALETMPEGVETVFLEPDVGALAAKMEHLVAQALGRPRNEVDALLLHYDPSRFFVETIGADWATRILETMNEADAQAVLATIGISSRGWGA